MRVVFLGTPEFAVPSLEALLASRHEVAGVVCQPDRPAGRGRRTERPAVAHSCDAAGAVLHQPEALRREETTAFFRETGADVGVVVAFGRILKPWLLALPRHGFVNVHASILPRYRGAAPVARALLDGARETGVSIMRLDEGMDTGPVYDLRTTAVGPDETAGELAARLADLGARALLEVLDGIEAGTATPRAQEGEPSLAPPLVKEEGRLDWSLAAARLHDRVRAFNPWPGAVTVFRGAPLQLWRTRIADAEAPGAPGTILAAPKGVLRVAAGMGALDLIQLQLPGKKRVDARDFLNGARVRPKEVLG